MDDRAYHGTVFVNRDLANVWLFSLLGNEFEHSVRLARDPVGDVNEATPLDLLNSFEETVRDGGFHEYGPTRGKGRSQRVYQAMR